MAGNMFLFRFRLAVAMFALLFLVLQLWMALQVPSANRDNVNMRWLSSPLGEKHMRGLKGRQVNNLAAATSATSASAPVMMSDKTTQFTEHVLWVIGNLTRIKNKKMCPVQMDLTVKKPYSKPHIECRYTVPAPHSERDCQLMKQIFQNRVLPYNVSVGFSHDDFTEHPLDMRCLIHASPDAVLCVPNGFDRQSMVEPRQPSEPYGWKQPPRDTVPWEQRSPKPVFRGTGYFAPRCVSNSTASSYIRNIHAPMRARYIAVQYSVKHPEKLDARLNAEEVILRYPFDEECEKAKKRDPELGKLLTFNKIPEKDYFSKYQVALVLRGVGPAYRLSRHFMAGTAVILQYCHLKEWYVPFLKPYVHYIPLAEDLGNLTEVLDWVTENPSKVKEIADNGFEFHEQHLTFQKHEEHFHELLWRLSEHKHSGGKWATYLPPERMSNEAPLEDLGEF